MTDYSKHFSTLNTPATEQADARQVPNSGGGYSFQVDKWQQLQRWLILGAAGGTYYATEKKLTVDNAKAVIACLDEDGPRAVEIIAAISEAARAPKNDPAIFALAIASGRKGPKDDATRKAALAALTRVCRTGTHLFQFVEAAKGFRGWGRGMRKAVSNWYNSRSAEQVAYQVAKYGQRGGVSHRDLMRLSHPKPEHAAVFRYVIAGASGMGEREVERKKDKGAKHSYPSVGELPDFLQGFEELKTADERTALALIRRHGFTHEMVPSQLKNSAAIWEALLDKMPMTAMIRNLGKMTSIGLLNQMGGAGYLVSERLNDGPALRAARIHPISLLSALRVYQQGHGEKGKLTWEANRAIVDALNDAFYLSFETLEPTGKRTLLCLDISGSMGGGEVAGLPDLTPRMATAAMAMVTARVEKHWGVVGFGHTLLQLAISPKQRLDDVMKVISDLPFGRTDPSLPIDWARESQTPIEVFAVYTDNEVNTGPHPHQTLVKYRQATGIPAKLAVCATSACPFTIADPSDAGMLDFAGFDSAAPIVLADFARG
jgi:60 kDa SS-A/Ro ribonucleoprotein